MDCPPDTDRTADVDVAAEVRVDTEALDLDGTDRDAHLTTIDTPPGVELDVNLDADLDADTSRTDLGVDEALVDAGVLTEE